MVRRTSARCLPPARPIRTARPMAPAAGRALLWLACTAVVGPAHAWPDKPIRMVAVSAPGGSTDLLARLYASRLGPLLGQQILIDNRAGGGGMIASELVARAPADGYTLLFAHTSHSVLPSMHMIIVPRW